MNPENQQQQNQQPNQLYPPNPAPQVYGPANYSPFPASPPPPPPGKKSKLPLILGIVVAVAVVGTAAAVLLTMGGNKNGSNGSGSLSRAYDSPVGLLSALQSTDVKSGTIKVTASYVTGGDFTREAKMAVNDTGHVSYEMVTDDKKVNTLLQALYAKANPKKQFDAARYATTRNMSYDFASIMGYHYLYDKDGGPLTGFIPEVEAAKAAPKPAKKFTLTTACDSALAEVKKQTDITTKSVHFEFKEAGGGRTDAVITFASRQAIDKAVNAFFDSCYNMDDKQNAILKAMVDQKRDDVTASPTFSYGQEDGVAFVEVSAPPSDTSFGGKLRFEAKDTSAKVADLSGETVSFKERRNQFGLTYSICRVDPVVTRGTADGYRFVREDSMYTYPSSLDTGYYCKTTIVPPQFKLPASVGLTSSTNKKATVTGKQILGLAGFHDLTYEIEQYNLSNKRYPGPTEFRDLANSGSGDIVAVVQQDLVKKTLVYNPLPEKCVGTCNDYSLLFTPAAGVQLSRSTYKAE